MHDPCPFCERLQYAVHVLFVVGDIIGSYPISIKVQAYPGPVCHDHGVIPIKDRARNQEHKSSLNWARPFAALGRSFAIYLAGAYLPVRQATEQERHFVDVRICGVHQREEQRLEGAPYWHPPRKDGTIPVRTIYPQPLHWYSQNLWSRFITLTSISISYFSSYSLAKKKSSQPHAGHASPSPTGWSTSSSVSSGSGFSRTWRSCPRCPPFGFPVFLRLFGICLSFHRGVWPVGGTAVKEQNIMISPMR